ncbi:conserved exported hypothetical protein [Crenothrix polyspora]|uniref:Tll0287-like domain-containing protein n=1 Tax=Crenothrix polyspora TaxID=360316 RepID=A0A1R4HB76_9GAMM|nr:DUF3365 domain-containing protein [Crenothrix polyspora]SJM93512.1 conserved exported hypothetical protein [Crenothrix polyspora]
MNICFYFKKITLLGAIPMLLAGCQQQQSGGVNPQSMADAIHTVIQSDRTAYTKLIVNRLAFDEKVIKVSEHWQDDKALVLPAQMFRAGAEIAAESQNKFSYSLLSEWPLNKQNAAKTEIEKQGLKQVGETATNFYAEEKLGDKHFFTAVYPDVAVAEACVQCHNKYPDTPKKDFKLGDVMGGVVVRIPLD